MVYQTIINCEDLQSILHNKEIVIIDCRHYLSDLNKGQIEYQNAHIPNAFFAHLDHDLSGEIIPRKTGRHPFPPIQKIVKNLENWTIDSTKQVIVYDQSHGGIAARLWLMLNWLGHENVAVLNGGWQRWQQLNLPVSTAIPNRPKTTFTPTVNQNLLVDADFIQTHIENPILTLVDARAAIRYRGETEPIDPIAGHIPTALSFPFLQNLDKNHEFISIEDLKNRFESIYNQELILYCGSGVTACHNILALKLIGKTDVRLYAGSWSDWITDTQRNFVQL